MNDIEQVKQETLPIPVQAKAIIVKDEETLRKANETFLVIDALMKKIDETMDPVIAAAHKSHRVALDKKAELKAPLIEGRTWLTSQVVAYNAEVERKRAEEAEKARQQALKDEAERRRREEEQRLEEAAALEAAGLVNEAEALVAETVEETSKPMEVYAAAPETPKVKLDGMAIKTFWSAQVYDLKALCKAIGDGKCPVAYVEANMSALNAQARSLKKEMAIPGVRAVSTSSAGASGGRRAA